MRETTVTITWNGSDTLSGIDHYEVSIDSGQPMHKGTETTHTFTNINDGEHEVEVIAIDKAGNKGYDWTVFTVNTSLFGPPGWFDEILVLGGTPAVIGLAYLLIRRRKKNQLIGTLST